MLRYELDADDLGSVRFAISPVNESVRSLRAVFEPARFPTMRNWSDYARQAVRRLNVPVLRALVNRRLWTPDCLTQRPQTASPKVAAEFRTLRALDPVVLREQLTAQQGAIPSVLDLPDDAVVETVADALEEYWSLVVSPYWEWLRRTLEADIAYRGRRTMQLGLATALNDISSTLTFASGVITVSGPVDRVEAVAGRGLVMTPSMFSSRVAMLQDAGAPMLMYAARGQGAMWEQFSGEPPSLSGLIGKRRAQLLELLDRPASSTQIAAMVGVSAPAINQHLRALQSAGLLVSFRDGKSVMYRRTTIADSLTEGRDPGDDPHTAPDRKGSSG